DAAAGDAARTGGRLPARAGAAVGRPDGVVMSAPAVPREVPVGELLEAVPDRQILGSLPATVRGLTDDSRKVGSGDCFVAVRGARVDGRRFIPQAVERGARAVVAEPPDPLPGEVVGRILVPDSRR